MSLQQPKPRPWLIAAWPGMGNVAVLAVTHLIEQLRMNPCGELDTTPFFEATEVQVRSGLTHRVELPRGLFFCWSNPGRGRDLVVFIGEAQPQTGTLEYAREVVLEAKKRDVERVVTFASLASAMHPSLPSKVSGVATDTVTLDELRRAEVRASPDGQIGGLNGLLLIAAANLGVSGFCLLADIPYFAMRVANPKAARAALSVFSLLAEVDIPLEKLDAQAAIVDRALIEALEQMEQSLGEDAPSASRDEEEKPEVSPPEDEKALSEPDRARIERLFDAAKKNQGKAVALKKELDRLGVFPEYEGRFLDLFRRTE
ncbi:MAG: PAC2 family protein [Phycisphaeraceae bacterium]|nr:PAC2 family protein [Phycisphaeraceae bacterium]